jgi:hypothetical protein
LGAEELAYSYASGAGGGIAIVEIDVEQGKIVGSNSLYSSANLKAPNKVRRSRDRQWLILSNEDKVGPHLHFVARDGGATRTVVLPDSPDEFRVHERFLLATCSGDWLAQVRVPDGVVERTWNAENLLDPKGNAPQDIQFVVDGNHVVISFQKDSKKGTKRGNRLAIFRVPEMIKVADLQLPRDHPELHLGVESQEEGPGPEVVLVARTSDRLLATLDLYGAVLITDWKAALRGEFANAKTLPTSLDQSWGTAFPDRLVEMYFAGQPYVLVCNAGSQGGAVVASMNSRRIVWKREVPPGLENPIYIRSLQRAYSVCSGKTKQRQGQEIVKSYHPQAGVFVFDFTTAKAVRDEPVRRVAELFTMQRIAQVPGDRPLLLIAGGATNPDQLVLFDPKTETVLDQQPAIGTVMQFEGE